MWEEKDFLAVEELDDDLALVTNGNAAIDEGDTPGGEGILATVVE